jgi:hypothetical protein
MMLSSLYSSLPAAAASTANVAPAKVFEPKQSSSDEKRIVLGIRSEILDKRAQLVKEQKEMPFSQPFIPRPLALGLNKFGGKLKKGFARGRRRNRNRDMIPMAVSRTLHTSTTCHHIFRFLCTAGGTYPVTNVDIFGALGGICTVTNSTIQLWASSFRLRRVSVAESAQSVASVNATLTWFTAGDLNTKDESTIATSIPYDRPSVLSEAPPKNSLASFWTNTSSGTTNTFFTIMCAIGAEIDVSVDFTLISNGTPGALTGITTATLGNQYYLSLDGRGSNKLQPAGLPTTS